jgi:hypothetical protein
MILDRLVNHYYYRRAVTPLTDVKIDNMYYNGKLADYIEQVENVYTRIIVRNKKQALEILKVRFHNQNLIGAFNERLTKEQKSNPDYAISCCIGLSVDPSWSSVCRSITAVNSRIAGYVSDKYQVLEIDKQEDGELIFAVLEHKNKSAETAHNLFWAHYCNNEWYRASKMALGMKLVWDRKLADYYEMMYQRMGGQPIPLELKIQK